MRIVFLGSPNFAVPALHSLAASDDIVVSLVVTQPDRPAGRSRALTPPPVKLAATELGLPIMQPETLRDAPALDELRAAAPDLLVVVAYGELLRRDVLTSSPHGALNVHPSLLPRYRGASPIPAAILTGDMLTGTSVIKLIRRLDAGPIVAQHELNITQHDTTATLSERLAAQAAELLPEVCRAWVAGQLTPREQDEAQATYTREWTKDDARIDWAQPAEQIERLTRAALPWPIAWTLANGARLQVLRVALADAASQIGAPGTATQVAGRLLVQTGTLPLELVEVQPAGKRPLAAADWWRGLRVERLQLG